MFFFFIFACKDTKKINYPACFGPKFAIFVYLCTMICTSISRFAPFRCHFLLCLVLLVTAACSTAERAEGEYDRLVCGSSVQASLIVRLGAADRLLGVLDKDYIVDSTLLRLPLRDYGSITSPRLEQLAADRPGALLLSPVEGQSYGPLASLGIPIIDCRDYLEPTPLSQAAWMKFYGRLVGQAERADSLYEEVEKHYNALKITLTAQEGSLPRTPEEGDQRAATSQLPPRGDGGGLLLVDLPMNGEWRVPCGGSYLGTLYRDAGLRYAFADIDGTGSTPLSIEKVVAEAAEADVWFIKYYAPDDWTYARLLGEYPFCERIKAFREHHVYGCNTAHVPYYEQAPFAPDLLLEDFAGRSQHFFTPLE